MRGHVDRQENMWFTMRTEDFIPKDHPLREIKKLADAELARLAPVFNKAYAKSGRRSVPPERLIKATLLQALFSIRSERQLCEQIHYNLLFRWFLDLKPDDAVFDPTTFTKNRDRFAEHGFAAKAMLKKVRRRHGLRPKTLAADKGYDDGQFLHDVEHDLKVKPQVFTPKVVRRVSGFLGPCENPCSSCSKAS